MIVAFIKKALHRPRGGVDVSAGLKIVKNLGQADEPPTSSGATADQPAFDKAERFDFIDQDGRWLTCLIAGHDQHFRFTPVEFKGAACRLDQTANFSIAGFLNAKPAFLDRSVCLGTEPSEFPLSDPRGDDHVLIDVPEESDRSNAAKRHEGGRVADERHRRL